MPHQPGERHRGDEQDQGDADRPQGRGREGKWAGGHTGGIERQRHPRDAQHTSPEGDASQHRYLRHLGKIEAGGAIDAIARRPAGQHREAEIVAERIAGERPRRAGPPGQRLAHRRHRDMVVTGQRQIADDGQSQRRRDPPCGHRRQRGAHLLQMDMRERFMQRGKGDARDARNDQCDDQAAVAGRNVRQPTRRGGHATRCQTCDLQRKPPIRQPEMVSCCGEFCLIRDEKLRPISGI